MNLELLIASNLFYETTSCDTNTRKGTPFAGMVLLSPSRTFIVLERLKFEVLGCVIPNDYRVTKADQGRRFSRLPPAPPLATDLRRRLDSRLPPAAMVGEK